MTRTKLKHAIAEAESFLRIAIELEKEKLISNDNEYFYGGKLTGAVIRASMELTLVLADFREINND